MNRKKISIIITCFNEEEYIQQAVFSALDQNYDNKEIIVVDDGSNASTRRKIESLSHRIDKLIFQENQGVSGARNRGIVAATGEYILILDGDDYFESDFCKKAIDHFLEDSEIKLVTCYSNWFDKKRNKIFIPQGGKLDDILISNVAMGSSMFKRRDWKEVGGYDEEMLRGYEDWEFYIRLLMGGGYVYVIPEVLFNYRNKPNSRNKKANLSRYTIMEYIYNKHADLYKDNFSLFIHEWLKSNKKNEAFKQRVIDSLDYKVGSKILRPFRLLGLFRKGRDL